MNILWTNSTLSGIGDRMIDLCLLSTYAKIKNATLYLGWRELDKNHKQSWDKSETVTMEWKGVRYVDYLYDNIKQYFTFPNNVVINNDPPSIDEYFESYLGGVYSPIKFYNEFMSNIVSRDVFINEFFKTTLQIKPTKKLKSIVGDTQPDLTLHIRREDKVRDKDRIGGQSQYGFEFIQYNELEFLKNKTFEVFEKLYSEDVVTYISSDEDEEKNSYSEKFNVITSENFKIDFEFEKTYIDLYLMSISKTIILSQRHSNFSILASLINRSRLIYLYNQNCNIHEFKFNELDNFFYYEYIMDKNNII